MILNPLTDIDELLLTILDRNSRTYMAESISAYRAQAFRAAIVSTWTAMAYDIIAKIDQLATQEEKEAVKSATEFASARKQAASNDQTAIKKMLECERRILDSALSISLILDSDKRELQRLQDDRHLCAHPAFSDEDNLFQPTLELVRAHLVHAIQLVLQKPAIQGKTAITRLFDDIKLDTFPANQLQITNYLESKFLRVVRPSLLKNIAEVLIENLVSPSESALEMKRPQIRKCLTAMWRRTESAVLEAASNYFKKFGEVVPETHLPGIVSLSAIHRKIAE